MERFLDDCLRANTYALLAGLLIAPPRESVLDVIHRIPPSDDKGAGALASAWRALRLAVERVDVEALDDEYHALFIGIGRGEVVPYGSWYVTGLLMDKPLALLRRDLAGLGFERQQGVHEPEDHAAALCEIMGLIIAHNEEISLGRQREFFVNHVGPWMGLFFRDLQQAASARFYRAVGHLGEQFIEFERSYLSMSV